MSLLDLIEQSDASAPLLVVTLAEPPIGKGRPRARIVKPRHGPQFVNLYTPSDTRRYEARLRDAALRAMRGQPPLEGPLAVTVWAYMAIPPSWPLKRQQAAYNGDIRPTGKPDDDNLAKAARDALNTTRKMGPGAWLDDAQIVDGRTIKLYARRKPGLIIEVRRAGAPPTPWVGATLRIMERRDEQ